MKPRHTPYPSLQQFHKTGIRPANSKPPPPLFSVHGCLLLAIILSLSYCACIPQISVRISTRSYRIPTPNPGTKRLLQTQESDFLGKTTINILRRSLVPRSGTVIATFSAVVAVPTLQSIAKWGSWKMRSHSPNRHVAAGKCYTESEVGSYGNRESKNCTRREDLRAAVGQ